MSQIIIANDLRTGEIVYFAQDRSWTDDLARAKRFDSEEDAVAVVESKEIAAFSNTVVGVEAIAVSGSTAADRPVSFRDVIRATGPTVREDLNRVLKRA
jgi:hypothetical protein